MRIRREINGFDDSADAVAADASDDAQMEAADQVRRIIRQGVDPSIV